MRNSRAGLKAAPTPKISSSGLKRIRVPFLRDGPTCWIGPCTWPRLNDCRHSWPSRQTVTSSRSDRAFTTETPTPCRPPEVS